MCFELNGFTFAGSACVTFGGIVWFRPEPKIEVTDVLSPLIDKSI